MSIHLPGVFSAYRKDGSRYFRSSITYRNKHISLGSFDLEGKANEAYLDALSLVGEQSFSPEDYSTTYTLPFEKWIILINFRNNGIYFPTPIYLHNRFFNYYLTEHTILKFDLDDLFYYSSHKIMKRDGHLFVSDYGMQVNILNRYGIKNYGIPGKDYLFVNGDSFDFRYENIKILNSYHGVSSVIKKGKSMYKASIHINGYYTIGFYLTEIEAAIAYNKAIDILQSNGFYKNFAQNYAVDISPSSYADIYSKLKISAKILHYRAE